MNNSNSGNNNQLVVIFGGNSAEHDVSCSSAANVLKSIDTERYNTDVIGITETGSWVEVLKNMTKRDQDELPEILSAEGTPINPTAYLTQHDPHKPIIFPVLHGPNGEDGTIQGFFELLQLPYVGSRVLSSALCMDKLKAKETLNNAGIKQANWAGLHVNDIGRLKNGDFQLTLEGDLFVKPANMGSSIGITKIHDRTNLVDALYLAAEYDEWIVVEEAIIGREIEIAILGNEDPIASVPGEIIPGSDFYDYNDKYSDGATLEIPAKLAVEQTKELQELALNVFRLLRCKGLARIDFFLENQTNKWLLNEVNTMPGFTPISMYPKLWAQSGISNIELVERLIQSAS